MELKIPNMVDHLGAIFYLSNGLRKKSTTVLVSKLYKFVWGGGGHDILFSKMLRFSTRN